LLDRRPLRPDASLEISGRLVGKNLASFGIPAVEAQNVTPSNTNDDARANAFRIFPSGLVVLPVVRKSIAAHLATVRIVAVSLPAASALVSG